MKVKAIIEFNDKETKTLRKVGDIFECTDTRAQVLLDNNAVEIVKEVKPKKKVVADKK